MKRTISKIPFLLKASIGTMLVQSFVISNVIKGLVFSYLFILIQFAWDLVANLRRETTQRILGGVIKFLAVFGAVQIIIQFINAVINPYFGGLILISPEAPGVYLFRASLFTQSIYLFACVVFFLYLYNYLKVEGSAERLLKIAKIGIIIYVCYGFYEFIGYQITGRNLDFLSNRVTGEDHIIGYFQRVVVGDMMLQRMKSLAGEPSMFAYSMLPFVILFYHLKDRIYLLFLVALILSTATTAALGLVFFIIVELVLFRKSLKFVLILGGILAAGTVLFYEIMSDLYGFTFSKFMIANMSSIDRFEKLTTHLSYFINSDILHIIFGYGFGYVRSTDGIATMLINTGLAGTFAFVAFLTYPIFKIRLNTDYRRGLAAAVIVLILLIFISVPEFYYIHIWFLAALLWYEYFLTKKEAGIAEKTG